tara:strand:- start:491 stop:727 length:237 start_codon:yes stop_codon:yes gene_type:complete
MRKKISKRYNKKLKEEFKQMQFFKNFGSNTKLYYVSGINSDISKSEMIKQGKKIALMLEGKESGYKKYIRKKSVFQKI